MLQTPSLYLAAYAIISLMVTLPVKWPYKITGALIILLCALKYHFYRHFGGFMDPNLPRWLLVCMEAAYGALLIGVFCCLVKDALSLILLILRKIRVCKLKTNRLYVNLFIMIFALGAGIYGTTVQFMTPKINHETVAIKNLDTEFDGFKIAQISDLHIGPLLKAQFLSKVTAAVNESGSDLLVITGDLVDGRVSELKNEFRPLLDVNAPFGVLAITGNHEYYSGAYAWIEALKDFKVRFLQNEHVNLHKGSGTLTIGGINDGHSYKSEMDKVFADSGNHARIFLAHKPQDAIKADADLVLAGHTHGGTMIFLQPVIGKYNNGYVSGRYEFADKILYVNNGTGIWSGFSCRFFVPPEITVFTLKRAS